MREGIEMDDVVKEGAKVLGSALAVAFGKGLAALIESGDLDAAYATMVEHLSDARLAAKNFPDGKFIPG